MITVITDEQQIKDLHTKFHEQLSSFLTESIKCWVGYPSGSFEATVKFSSELNIWISRGEHDNRFWNGFGVGKPIEGRNNSLNGEINFSRKGLNRRIAGVFAIEDGTILVLHRGKIGGGKVGIGKNYFINNFRGDFVTATDGNRETKFCLIGELNSPHFPMQVANFINEIHRVKHPQIEGKTQDFEELADFQYTDEKFGQVTTERNDPITIERTHGIVANALAMQLKASGNKVGNDRNRDLFIYKDSKITALFEIKTTSSTQALYTAVGQLIIYSIPIKNKVTLIAVLPTKLSKTVENKLLSLGIIPFYYHWENNIPVFKGLDEILKNLI